MNEKVYNQLKTDWPLANVEINFHGSRYDANREMAQLMVKTYAGILETDMEIHRADDSGTRWVCATKNNENKLEQISVTAYYSVKPFTRLSGELAKEKAMNQASHLFPEELEWDEYKESLEERPDILFDASGELDVFHGLKEGMLTIEVAKA